MGAYIDLFPFSNNFRVSVGLTKSLINLDIKNVAGSYSVSIGNANISGTLASGDIKGNAKFDTAPSYLGIGWGQVASSGWGFRFDVGAHFLGKPDVTYTINRSNPILSSVSDADIHKEEQRAQDDIGDVIYPEVSLAISYSW